MEGGVGNIKGNKNFAYCGGFKMGREHIFWFYAPFCGSKIAHVVLASLPQRRQGGGRGYVPVRGGKVDGFVVPVLRMVGPDGRFGERQVYYFIVSGGGETVLLNQLGRDW